MTSIWENHKRGIIIAALVLALLSAFGLYQLGYYLNFNPFVRSYPLDLALSVCADNDGTLWIVDDSGKRLTRVNPEQRADRVVYGGNAFERCDSVCPDGKGGVYIVNIYIKSMQERFHEQQVLHLDEYGRQLEVIYNTGYDRDNSENRLRGLCVLGGKLYFAEIDENRVVMRSYDQFTGNMAELGSWPVLNKHWSSAVCDPGRQRLLVAYKSGEIMEYSNGNIRQLPGTTGKYVPMRMAADYHGQVYFYDALSKMLYVADNGRTAVAVDGKLLQQAYGDDFVFISSLAVAGERLYAVALNKVAEFSGGGFKPIDDIGFSNRIITLSVLAWLSLMLLCCAALILLTILYFLLLRRLPGQALQPLLLGLVPIIAAAVFIISTINADNSANRYADNENRVKHLSRFLGEIADAAVLQQAYKERSYQSGDYKKLERLIDEVSHSGNSGDINFYSAFYYARDGKLYCVLDSTDDFMMNYTLPRLPEYEYIFQAYEKGTAVSMKVSDREGGWLCSAYPVKDKTGKVAGVAEVDCETSYIDYINHGDILVSLLKLISLLYVAFLLTYELSVFIGARQSARTAAVSLRSDLLSTRTLAFAVFFCLRMVYGFMPLLVNRYPLAHYGISFELAVGLSFSLEYLSVLAINSFAGIMAARIGWKPLTWLGVFLAGAAALTSYYAPNLLLFYAGQLLTGFAVNIAYCGMDTRLSAETDETYRARFRPEQMAGIYSGSLCGILVGLWLYERVSPEAAVWCTVSVATIVAMLLALIMHNGYDLTSDNDSGSNILLAFRKILADREARNFFLLVALPGTMFIAEPLFIIQMFVSQNGYSMMNIGWGEMAAEFAIVYFGARLFSGSLKRFSLREVCIIGSALLVSGHLLAAAGYTIWYMYAGMLVVSFGYAVIHSAFPEYCLSFEVTRSIGRQTMSACYELVLSVGYAIGFSLIGQLCGMVGLQRGWLMTTGGTVLFLLLFLMFWRRRRV